MRQRRKSLAKILLLQDQLKNLNAWKLAALDQQRAALEESQRATIEAIDRDAISSGILVTSATRRLRNIDTQIATLKDEHRAQTQRAQEQAIRARLAERLVENVEAKYRMQQERADLGDLIERSVAKKTASPA
ncbi:MAG: hypothetical protein ABSE69_12620 [Roseiarcus sp.]|jgi:hypothetical protein